MRIPIDEQGITFNRCANLIPVDTRVNYVEEEDDRTAILAQICRASLVMIVRVVQVLN